MRQLLIRRIGSLVDYIILRKTRVKVSNLMSKNRESIYWYSGGFNSRAIAAVLGTVWIPFREYCLGNDVTLPNTILQLAGS